MLNVSNTKQNQYCAFTNFTEKKQTKDFNAISTESKLIFFNVVK